MSDSEILLTLSLSAHGIAVLKQNRKIAETIERLRDRKFTRPISEEISRLAHESLAVIEAALFSEDASSEIKLDVAMWIVGRLVATTKHYPAERNSRQKLLTALAEIGCPK